MLYIQHSNKRDQQIKIMKERESQFIGGGGSSGSGGGSSGGCGGSGSGNSAMPTNTAASDTESLPYHAKHSVTRSSA